MFRDDPDTMVATVRVASEQVSDTHARGRLELVGRAEGLELREEKRGRPGDYFRRPKTSDVLTGYYCRYIYPLGRQTNSDCDETGQAVCLHYNKTARQVATHSENIFMPLIK